MRVLSLKLTNFIQRDDGSPVHKNLHVKFRHCGIITITGKNGAGKSSVAEGVAWAVFGKTLRGRDPTMEVNTTAEVLVALPGGAKLKILRERVRGKKQHVTIDGVKYDTAEKAQPVIDKLVGEFRVWQTAFVLSAEDATRFTGATDAERKRVLESLLGLERFDAALKNCRVDLVAAKSRYAKNQQLVAENTARRDEAKRALEAQRTKIAAMGETVTRSELTKMSTTLEKQKKLHRETADKWYALESQSRVLSQSITAARVLVDEAKRELQRVKSAQEKFANGQCPTCTRPMSDAWHAQAERDLKKASRAAKGAKEQADLDEAAVRVKQDKMSNEIASMQSKVRELDDSNRVLEKKLDRADHDLENREVAESDLKTIRQRIKLLSSEIEDAQGIAEISEHDVNLLSTVDKILGTKGVRARLAEDALGALQACANRWLTRISDGEISLTLSSTTEQASGATGEAIALNIEGVGGGAYKGCSTGQRRRVDIAVMLAMSEVAAGASGMGGGTIFADEAFDGLDADGESAVLDVLDELAAEAVVVVISHRKDLVAKISAAQRISFGV